MHLNFSCTLCILEILENLCYIMITSTELKICLFFLAIYDGSSRKTGLYFTHGSHASVTGRFSSTNGIKQQQQQRQHSKAWL